MEITNEQLSKLREKLGDKELREMGIELPVKYDTNKIYCYSSGNYLYKIHATPDGRYCSFELENSHYVINESISFERCISRIPKCYKIQEFDNVRDFAEWILTNTKK